jgi:hypothetical protein
MTQKFRRLHKRNFAVLLEDIDCDDQARFKNLLVALVHACSGEPFKYFDQKVFAGSAMFDSNPAELVEMVDKQNKELLERFRNGELDYRPKGDENTRRVILILLMNIYAEAAYILTGANSLDFGGMFFHDTLMATNHVLFLEENRHIREKLAGLAGLLEQYENNAGDTDVWKIAVSGLNFGFKFWDTPIVNILYREVLKTVGEHRITAKEFNKIYRKKMSKIPKYAAAAAEIAASFDDFERELYEISPYDELQEYVSRKFPGETMLFDVNQENVLMPMPA